jgi:hypothetical protein
MRKAIFAVLLSTVSVITLAQQAEQDLPALAPGEVQKLFDSYALVEAQNFLGLNEQQFASFLPKFRAMQETRRRSEQERLRLLQELNRMTNVRASQISETDVRDRLRALRELQTRTASEMQRAYDAVDQMLDLRQQARFRVFEQHMEQRRLQLLMRARQANRQANPNRQQQRPQQRPQQ